MMRILIGAWLLALAFVFATSFTVVGSEFPPILRISAIVTLCGTVLLALLGRIVSPNPQIVDDDAARRVLQTSALDVAAVSGAYVVAGTTPACDIGTSTGIDC